MRERERAKRGNKGRTQRLPAESTAHTHTAADGLRSPPSFLFSLPPNLKQSGLVSRPVWKSRRALPLVAAFSFDSFVFTCPSVYEILHRFCTIRQTVPSIPVQKLGSFRRRKSPLESSRKSKIRKIVIIRERLSG
jgi:hypothetical protein